MKVCFNCGLSLNKHQYNYCSNKCQMDRMQAKLILNWLMCGTIVTSGDKNHFTKRYISECQNHACAICGIKDWQGKELVLILDHIDGNSTNNSFWNLRLICPNCDSQLPTFKSRNRGKGRHERRARYAAGKSF